MIDHFDFAPDFKACDKHMSRKYAKTTISMHEKRNNDQPN